MRDKRLVFAGFSLSLVFGLLNGIDFIFSKINMPFGQNALNLIIIGSQAAAFLPPALLLSRLSGEKKKTGLHLRRLPRGTFAFILEFSFAVSLLSFILNYLVAFFFEGAQAAAPPAAPGGSFALAFAAAVLAPAFCEELYLRGSFFTAYEEACGTLPAMFLSAAAFAMMHGSPYNFAGPFAAGLTFSYLVFVTNSLWAAVLGHFLNNLLAVLMGRLMTNYAAFGLWFYFLGFCVLLFFIFCALSLRSLERLVSRGKIPRLNPPPDGWAAAALKTFLSPAFILFSALYLMKVLLLP